MNVFEKLNEARLRFQNAGVSKSGHNKFAGYTYYELADILPFCEVLLPNSRIYKASDASFLLLLLLHKPHRLHDMAVP